VTTEMSSSHRALLGEESASEAKASSGRPETGKASCGLTDSPQTADALVGGACS